MGLNNTPRAVHFLSQMAIDMKSDEYVCLGFVFTILTHYLCKHSTNSINVFSMSRQGKGNRQQGEATLDNSFCEGTFLEAIINFLKHQSRILVEKG